MILGIEKLARQLEVDVTPYFLQANTRQEILQNVGKALADGKKVVIGGMTGCRLAAGGRKRFSLPADCLRPGRLLERHLRSEAAGENHLEAREKALALQTLLDNAYEGLAAIDRNNCIFFHQCLRYPDFTAFVQRTVSGKEIFRGISLSPFEPDYFCVRGIY
ncbi:MAG: hypothetical protein HFG08_03205 [Oscillibacter sp.]|nr:hypothetical protein [Oscillibacter sp.]